MKLIKGQPIEIVKLVEGTKSIKWFVVRRPTIAGNLVPNDLILTAIMIRIQADLKGRVSILFNKNKTSLTAQENGPIHDQDWCKSEIEKFYSRMNQLQSYHCLNCKELWPTSNNSCETCKKDKEKFTIKNNMDLCHDKLPNHIKNHIHNITMIEEMLISPILSVMTICRLPGGQLVNKGYIANFAQNIVPLCQRLPRLTSQLPILIVKKIDQNNVSKEFQVNRLRITELLRFFCENNPDWKSNGM